MIDEKQPDSLDETLMFFGCLTASLSHEITNSLAIINEQAGLLKDYLAQAPQGQAIDPEKMKKITDAMTRQIERGKEATKRLNRFAHSVDSPKTTIELNDLLRDSIETIQRIASMKRITLVADLSHEPISLTCSCFAIHRALFFSIDLAMSATQENGKITFRSGCSEDRATIEIWFGSTVRSGDYAGKMDVLAVLEKQFAGKAETIAKNGDITGIRLYLPTETE